MDEELEGFEVLADAPVGLSEEFQGVNASRFAIAGALGAADDSANDPGSRNRPASRKWPASSIVEWDMLKMFGFDPGPILWDEQPPSDLGALLLESAYLINRFASAWDPEEVGNDAWDALREQTSRARLSFLAAGVCSPLEREGAAAAIALLNSIPAADRAMLIRRGFPEYASNRWPFRRFDGWSYAWLEYFLAALDLEDPDAIEQPIYTQPWDGVEWHEFSARVIEDALSYGLHGRRPYALLSTLLVLAYWRVRAARRSSDAVVRGLTEALRLRQSAFAQTSEPQGPQQQFLDLTPHGELSTIIHGTWAWEGKWWLPGGEFYEYIQKRPRIDLYGGGAEFSWSGAYKESHRRTAGDRFKRWAESISPGTPLHTVFAHSYGAEVAARAVNRGARVERLVFLSAPIGRPHLQAIGRVGQVIDIRLKFDIVLALARRKQRLPRRKGLRRLVIDGAFWQHSATYNTLLWDKENIAKRVGL